MPGMSYGGGRRRYKMWRYPGVPIPIRLQLIYTDDPKKVWKPFVSQFPFLRD